MRILLVTALVLLAGIARAGPPELMGPRRPGEREKVLTRNGGSKATEEAVAAGLDWLSRHQDADGGWDADGFSGHCEEGGEACTGIGKGQHGEAMPCPFDHAISSLAVLAFLGRGHLPGDEGDEYGEMLEKALLNLRSPRDRWALALSTQAFAEAAVLTGKERWKELSHRGAESLLEIRQKDGAWGYAAPWRQGSDVPYTALVVQALAAARDAGFELPDDLRPRVDAWLDSLEESKGRLAYLQQGRRYGYTPTTSNAHCAAAIRELLQVGLTGARHRKHRALVQKQKPAWKISFKEVEVPGRGKVPIQIGHLSLYQWWYGTIAMFQGGGGGWSGWAGKLRTALLGHREKKGCARGSWDPEGLYERQTGGRVFATAISVLMLEQPYRHRRLSN